MEKILAVQKRRSLRKAKKRDITSRYGTVTSWDTSVFIYVDKRGGQTERRTLISLGLKGDLLKPVRNITGFELNAFPDKEPKLGNAEIPSVGSIIATRPLVSAVVNLSEQEFQVVLALATSGQLASVRLSFQEPRYGSALIVSCSFSSQPPEEE